MTKPRKRIDLDAVHKARDEELGDPTETVLGGVTFTLPASLPAIVLIGMGRVQNGDLEGFADVLTGLFGDRGDEAARLGLELDDIELIVEEAYELGEEPASAE